MQDLVQWLQRNQAALSARPLRLALAAVRGAALPEEHPDYWPTLQRCLALGWAEDAMDLLGLHSAWARWQHDPQRAQVQPQVGLPPLTPNVPVLHVRLNRSM